jgi:hypothetical protein
VSQERVSPKVRKSVLATPEFSRKMDEVKRQLQAVEDHEQVLAQWKTDNEAALKTNAELAAQYQREAQSNALRANELENKLKFYAEQGMIDYTPNQNNPNSGNTPPNNHPHSAPGNNQPQREDYMTRKDFDKAIKEYIGSKEREFSFLPAAQIRLVAEHAKLFPGQVPDMVEVTNEAWNSNRSLEDVWKEKYGVEARKKQMDEEAFNKKVDEQVNERLNKLRSEEALRGSSFRKPDEKGSPIYDRLMRAKPPEGKEPNLKIPRSKPSVAAASKGVQAAEAALREGNTDELVQRYLKERPL